MSEQPVVVAPKPAVAHEAHHEELGFWRKYVFSTDHKVIGIQYGITGLVFLLFGFTLMMLMRWQLAYPETALPLLGFLGEASMPGGTMLPEFYNSLGAMHGTIMVFLGVVPLAVGGFGNFVLPLQIGAPDMAFPKLNMISYWCLFLGGVIMVASFFVPGGAAQSGWTSYAPLANIATTGQTWWLIGMIFLITSSLLGAVNFITTTIQIRAKGLTFWRFPFFVWTQFVTAFLLLLAFPPLESAAVMQLMDRVLGTSFFLPSGLVVSGQVLEVAGGGNPLLWQHLFWFLAHPEVYVLILPAMGIIAEVIANNTRKPLWGYRSMVYSLIFLGFMSFIVWAHHMFMTGMGDGDGDVLPDDHDDHFDPVGRDPHVPDHLALGRIDTLQHADALCGRLSPDVRHRRAHGASARVQRPGHPAARHVLRYRPLPLRRRSRTILALFAGIYYWFPKATGRKMDETLGKIHFWGSFVSMNVVFMPMVHRGAGRRVAAPVRRRGDLHLCGAGPLLERCLLLGHVAPRHLPDSFHLQFLSGASGRGRRPTTTRGRPRRSSGRLRRLRRTAILSWRRKRIAGPTSTAFPARPRTSSRSTRPDRRWTFPTPKKSAPTPV